MTQNTQNTDFRATVEFTACDDGCCTRQVEFTGTQEECDEWAWFEFNTSDTARSCEVMDQDGNTVWMQFK